MIKNNIFDDGRSKTKLTLTTPNNVTQNKKIIIKGKLTAQNGTAITYAKLELKINNQTSIVKTNTKGLYNYTYNATKVGLNKII